jgi:hypothetical protein
LRDHSIEVSFTDDGVLVADASAEAVSDVALAAGVAVRELRATEDDLEQLFFQLTETGPREEHETPPIATTDTSREEVTDERARLIHPPDPI